MNRTTVYLPADLKKAVTSAAGSLGISEAELIRRAVRAAVASAQVPHRGAVFASDVLLADEVGAHLAGFGSAL